MNLKLKVVIATLSVAVVTLGGVTACGAGHRSSSTDNVDHAPASVLQFPNGFWNVAYKCQGHNMVYSLSHSTTSTALAGALAISPNDVQCGGTGK